MEVKVDQTQTQRQGKKMGYNKEKNTHVACKRGYQKLSLSLHSSDPDKVRECIDTPPHQTL